MSLWVMLQALVDFAALIGVTVMWLRLRRPPQDDPRMSRGLQLLQSKIAVLEDLSDRTDAQLKQLTHLIEQKARLLQNKIIEAEHQIQRVDQSMRKSKEVAEIFQDKIPHQEIIERQQTIKYVKAAQMAHSGRANSEIAAAVDLPIGQIELIAKLNKENLVFDPEALPEWVKSEIQPASLSPESPTPPSAAPDSPQSQPVETEFDSLFSPPEEQYSSLKRLGDEFRQACQSYEQPQPSPLAAMASLSGESSALLNSARRMTSKIVNSASGLMQQMEEKARDFVESTPSTAKPKAPAGTTIPVQKVEFPRVNINKNLR